MPGGRIACTWGLVHPELNRLNSCPKPLHWFGVSKEAARDEFLLPSCPPSLEAVGDQLFQSQM